MNTTNTIRELEQKIQRAYGEREAIIAHIKIKKTAIKENKARLAALEQARALVQTVASNTQKQLEYRVSELSTIALQAVLGKTDTKLKLRFTEKRNKTEADLLLEIRDFEASPRDGVGGGVVDLLGATLRFSLWSLMRPKPRPLFILDEPLKWLKGAGMPVKGMEMLSQISHKLGVQIIMVSHSPELIAGADNVIEIRGGV